MAESMRAPRVHGIAGPFFRRRDLQAPGAWYGRHLGLPVAPRGRTVLPWTRADAGADAVALQSPFKHDTPYFAPSEAGVEPGLRVDDLDAAFAALGREGGHVPAPPAEDAPA